MSYSKKKTGEKIPERTYVFSESSPKELSEARSLLNMHKEGVLPTKAGGGGGSLSRQAERVGGKCSVQSDKKQTGVK